MMAYSSKSVVVYQWQIFCGQGKQAVLIVKMLTQGPHLDFDLYITVWIFFPFVWYVLGNKHFGVSCAAIQTLLV